MQEFIVSIEVLLQFLDTALNNLYHACCFNVIYIANHRTLPQLPKVLRMLLLHKQYVDLVLCTMRRESY